MLRFDRMLSIFGIIIEVSHIHLLTNFDFWAHHYGHVLGKTGSFDRCLQAYWQWNADSTALKFISKWSTENNISKVAIHVVNHKNTYVISP